MSERETNELTTPAGRKVVVKTYVTARESLAALDEKKTAVEKTNALAVAIIVSIDGVSADLENVLLDLPLPEYAYLISKVKDISDGNFQPTN
jgi:hypothetical protein